MQIGIGTLLFIVFLVLKLTHVISWSWLWVTSPLWVGIPGFLGIALLVAVFDVASTSLYVRSKRRYY